MTFLKSLLSSIWGFLKRNRWYVLIIALSIPAIWDLLLPGYFPMHDDLQILRLQQFHQCFLDGQIPCRWIPDAGYGYGYPMFNYYPPLPYFVAEFFNVIGFNLFWSIKIMFILAMVLPGLTMYHLAKKFFGKLGGLLSALFYVYAPYHSVDIYVRGAANEAWALVWFPLIFYNAYQLIQTNKKKYIPFLALSFAALLMSHNVMVLIFSPLFALWVFYWLAVTNKWQKLKPLILSGLWSVGLAAFFFLVVLFEKNLVHVESMTVGYFNFLAHFADLNQMFVSRFWGYGGSIWGPQDDMAFPIGHFHWIVSLFVSGFTSISLIKEYLKQKQLKVLFKNPIKLVLVSLWPLTLIYIFLIHPRSIWFWQNLPLLYYAQFPWRLLAIPAFTFSFIVGGLIYLLKNINAKKWLLALVTFGLIGSTMIWNLPFFKIEKQMSVARPEKLSGLLWELQTTGGIFDYLPKAAEKPPGGPAHQYPLYIEGTGGIKNYQSGTNWLEFTAQVASESALIQVPLFDYPNWRFKMDSKPVEHTHEPTLGRVRLTVPQGTHHISAQLHNTPVRTIANWLTIASVGILLFFL